MASKKTAIPLELLLRVVRGESIDSNGENITPTFEQRLKAALALINKSESAMKKEPQERTIRFTKEEINSLRAEIQAQIEGLKAAKRSKKPDGEENIPVED
jgi:hypothetical protein